jgi:hypothetical protein
LLTIQHQGISNAKILIFNAIGNLLERMEAHTTETILDLNGYGKGIYFVLVADKSFKIVKQ